MIDKTDLRAAVAAGVLSEAQAAHLDQLAHARRGARSDLAVGDEPFELFRGFNEIFIVVGLIILAIGWSTMVGLFVTLGDTGNTFSRVVMASLLGAGILWLLAEYFTRRRRMVAPSIALSVLWGGNALGGFSAAFAQPFMMVQEDFSSLPLPLVLTTLALLAFWWRFRVPFAMAMIALGAFAVALVLTASRAGNPDSFSELFLLSAGGPFALVTLVLGVVVFAVAMVFDMSDPHRVTRRSANGFWLHVVAAPALVNTLALTLIESGQNALLTLVLLVFALVAIVIDRRSFLIAAVGYSVTLAFTVFGGEGGAYSIFALGVVLLLLGAFWERLRARLLRLMPFLPLDRLPPSYGATE